MKNSQVFTVVVVALAVLVILLLTDPGKDQNTQKTTTSPNSAQPNQPNVDPEMLKPVFLKEPPIVPNDFLSFIDNSDNINHKVLDLKTIELYNFTESGLGIRAKHDIKKDKLIGRVNLKDPTTSMNVLNLVSKCKELAIPEAEEIQHLMISIQLLYEELECDSKKTFFVEYMKDMRKRMDFKTLGYFWKDEEVNELQESFLKGMIIRQRNGIETLYQQAKNHPLLKCLSKKCGKPVNWEKILTKKNFEWAFFITFTRFFSAQFTYAERNFEGKIKILMPGIDYFNTHLTDTNAHQIITQNDFRIYASKDIKKGEQIYLKYWKEIKPNELLIVTYGFCDESNPNSLHIFDIGDYFTSRFEKITDEDVKKRLYAVLKKFGLFGFQYIRLNDDPEMKVLQPEFLYVLRAFQMSIEELEARNDLKDVSKEVENAALTNAVEMIQEKMKFYTTTYEQDVELLKNFKGNSNTRCAIIIRKEEKKILTNFINYLKNKIST